MNNSWILLAGILFFAFAVTVRAQTIETLQVEPELRLALKEAVESSASFEDALEGTVWLTEMSRRLALRVPDPFYRIELLKTIHEEATHAGLKPELVLAVIEVESKFDRFAVSSSGARGLMQVKPFWVKEIGHPRDNLFHPQTNLRYGCTILRYYLDRAGGNLRTALADYNGYSNPAYTDMVYLALTDSWTQQ